MPRKMKGKGPVADLVKKELAKALIPVITKELVKGVEKGIKKIRGRGLRPAGRGLKLAGQGRGKARMSGGVYVPSQLKGLISIAPPPHKKRPRSHGVVRRKGRRRKKN